MKTYRFLCILIFGLLGKNSTAQDLFAYYESLWNQDDISISRIEKKVDSIIAIYEVRRDDLNTIKIANEFYRKLYKKKLYRKAIRYGELEISVYQRLEIKNSKYIKALYNVGLFYFMIGDFEDSIRYYKEIISIDTDPYITAKTFCALGKYYYQKGDFFRSNDYYWQGITKLEKFENKKLLIKKYIDYSHVLLQIDTHTSLDRMLEVLDNANHLFDKLTSYSLKDYSSLNNNYANYYKKEKRRDFYKAKYYYYQNLKKAKGTQDSISIHASYTNLGALYIEGIEKTQKDSAVFFLKEGLKYSINNEQKSIAYHQLSNYFLEKKEYQKALFNIQKSLNSSIGLGDAIDDAPTFNSLMKARKKNNILGAFIQKATILIKLYDIDQDIDLLKHALDNLLYADTLVDILLEVSKEEGSRLYWREEASEIYLKGILVCEILDAKEKAFYFSEKKKAILLTQDVLENTEKQELPDNFLEKEIVLKKHILDLEKQVKDTKPGDSLRQLEHQRFELKRQFERYEDSLKILFPAYYKDKETTKIVQLEKIQEELDANQVIISYISNNDEDEDVDSFNLLYAVLVSRTDAEIIEIGALDTIEKKIRSYRYQLSKPFETEKDRSQFKEVAFDLSNILIPKDKISMSLDHKHLIIIPDGTLQYIPFESLVVHKNPNRYLLEDNEISYAYSMSFLKQNAAVERKPSNDVLAFSPVSFEHSNLEDITNSIHEINVIGNTSSLINYKEKKATKLNFLSNTLDYKVIHLATHANFSDNLQIAFYDTNLEYHELYTSKNQAELVVLSACNTSLGEMAKGEGVMSLARGFFYAGANTVVSSLWNANDKSTSQIMGSFYKNLNTGQTKSKSLHNAKINYLKSASLSDASPHYWAAFILIGDSETKLFTSNNLCYGILLFFILILVIRLIISFLKKNNFSG